LRWRGGYSEGAAERQVLQQGTRGFRVLPGPEEVSPGPALQIYARWPL